MSRIALALLLCGFLTQSASAQSLSDQLDQATDYIGRKADDAHQYWHDHNPIDGAQNPQGNAPGQLQPPIGGSSSSNQNGHR